MRLFKESSLIYGLNSLNVQYASFKIAFSYLDKHPKQMFLYISVSCSVKAETDGVSAAASRLFPVDRSTLNYAVYHIIEVDDSSCHPFRVELISLSRDL